MVNYTLNADDILCNIIIIYYLSQITYIWAEDVITPYETPYVGL